MSKKTLKERYENFANWVINEYFDPQGLDLEAAIIAGFKKVASIHKRAIRVARKENIEIHQELGRARMALIRVAEMARTPTFDQYQLALRKCENIANEALGHSPCNVRKLQKFFGMKPSGTKAL